MCCLQAEHKANTTLIVRHTSSNSLAEMKTIWQLTMSMREQSKKLNQIISTDKTFRIFITIVNVCFHKDSDESFNLSTRYANEYSGQVINFQIDEKGISKALHESHIRVIQP